MDLRQFRYFVAVARERNFTRAARQLNIAQPPLSRQIQLLEEEVGVPLLIRNSRPVQLTDAGRLFFEQAIQVLGRVEQMQAATRRVGLHQRSVLSIGFVASTLYGVLPTLMRKLRQHAPELDIQMVELMSVQQIQALNEGRIDIGFGRVHHSDPNMSSIVLHEERLAVALPMESLMARESTPLPVHQLAGEKLIVYPKEPRPGFADQVLNILDRHGVQPGEVMEVREIQTALGLVAAEFGVCVTPASARQMRHDVHYRLIDGDRATSPVIVSHRANDSSKYISLTKQLIREMYAEHPAWLDAHN
ncbi:LysR family transcriptional regulator [Paraburkholderia fungorum]|jgi:LysR family transcriptional regulator, benzoate and cis,cis-muconate-responsive activator of ben and cat genes|uniref:LysR family transcriptional regulator n=1 Tax=Paraburkholderia fungorum TaxID=134537 RepID=UPI000DB226F5|nr:LysR family transcriptional regulator [Paraburkholderia fungorum]PZR50058.1 MAG: LysR family transcriptional regulator [Paraburkholderia fungorum]